MKDSTKAIRDQMVRSSYREHSVPMFLTSSFVFESAEHAEQMFAGEGEGNIYSRFSNPNTTELIDKFCALEGAEAGIATASGMAAVFTTIAAHLVAGDHIVACTSLFGNTRYIIQHILPSWGITHEFVDAHDKKGWEAAITDRAKMVMIETPTNPGLDILDLAWLSKFCKKSHTIFCVDNCFATPILQKPIEYGADIVIHSATKWIDGQGRVLGGLVVGSEEYIMPTYDFLRRTGASLSPFNAWLLSKSTETLDVRMQRHCETALSIAEQLEKHPKVQQVRYPHLPSHPQYHLAQELMKMGGGIITLDLATDKKGVFTFVNALSIPSITANLGDSRTIVTHPATTTHKKLSSEEQEQVGIRMSTLRFSIGLEDPQDLLDDIHQALEEV